MAPSPKGCRGALGRETSMNPTAFNPPAVHLYLLPVQYVYPHDAVTMQQYSSSSTMATNDVYCEVCQVGCDTNDVLQQHYLGKKHKKNLEKIESKEELQCEVCQVGCDTIDTLKQHYLGKKHKKNLEKASVNAPRTCSVCNVFCNSQVVFISHLNGAKHRAMVKKLEVRTTNK
ncbi:hypothetical protein LguiB_012359 [Lonicera macranthoides]